MVCRNRQGSSDQRKERTHTTMLRPGRSYADRACRQGTVQNLRRGTPRLFSFSQKRMQMGAEYHENMLLRYPLFL